MPLNTNFNQSPYFDDFDSDKNYYKMLFKPSVAIQAREMNQLETILQEQISIFGNNILKEGSIVKGGNFVEETQLYYIKLRDNDLTGQRINVNNYLNKTIVGSITGLKAVVLAVDVGLESQRPDLNTLYIKYLNTVNDVKTFNSSENINIVDSLGIIDYSITATIAGAIDTGSSPAVGLAYGVRCGEGVIFQKGYFIRFEDNLAVVSKYSNNPDKVVVGFQTNEIIVNSSQDTSLLDNSASFNNFNAPGADRLKLNPILVTKTLDEALEDDTFFAIQEYSNGRVSRRRLETQFNSIERLVERRTAEESGNYYVKDFPIKLEETANTENISVIIGSGLAYVGGKRIETVNDIFTNISKPTSFKQVNNQDIIANYGNFIEIENITSPFDITNLNSIDLRDASTIIGSAKIKTIIRASATIYRAYITSIIMNTGKTFSEVRKIGQGTSLADVILENSVAILKDTDFNSMIFPTGRSFIKSILQNSTDFMYRGFISASTGAGTTINITLPVGSSWTYSGSLNSIQREELLVINDTDNTIITSFTASVSGQQLTISGLTASKTYAVYYNAKKDTLTVRKKRFTDIYVKINCNTNTSGIYGLGVPDAYSILNVWKGTTYSESNSDITTSFVLNKNENSNFYGQSYIKAKSGVTLTNTDRLLVKIRVYETYITGDCYAVQSYIYSGSNIDYQHIGSFNGESLRNVLDFRPQIVATSAYALSPSAATVITTPFNNNAYTFGTTILPIPGSSIETSYQYDLGRIDTIMLDETGNFQIITGVESDNPVAPSMSTKGMIICDLNIPPIPTLPYSVASRNGFPEYGIAITKRENSRRYTMIDINHIDRRITNLEDYVSLSLLEKSAADLAIADSNGLNRFKNGIFVDTFDTLINADVTNDEFSSSIDLTEKEIAPRFRAIPLDLKILNMSNTISTTGGVVLNYNDEVFIKQPFATNVKSCTTNFYKFAGSMILDPAYDSTIDTSFAPDINLDIDLSEPFADFTRILNEIIPPQSSTISNRVVNSNSTLVDRTRTNTTTTTTTNRTITSERVIGMTNNSTSEKLGDFVTDVRFSNFMRSREIKIYVSGLRPNTQVYVYFDGKNVMDHVALGRENNNSVQRISRFGGQSLYSNSNGEVFAIFNIPPGTFYVGERKLEIFDVNSYDSSDSLTTYASSSYNGFNFSVEKTGLVTTTRIPDINSRVNVSVTTSTNIVTNVNRMALSSGSDSSDPLSQTFFIDENLSDDTDLFVTKLDLFFAQKSLTNGVTVELREVINGYPSGVTIPFSKVHLKASEIVVNSINGIDPTTIVFKAPIALKTNQEYAIAIMPDANDPDYRVWISKTGEVDIESGLSVTQDSNAGVLFTSTNNKTWTPYQDQDLKFILYKANFTSNSGTVNLTNRDHEFMNIANTSGTFINGEKIYNTSAPISANLNVISGNTIITGNINFQSLFTEGEYIIIEKGNNTEALRVQSANTTALIVSDVPTTNVNADSNSIYKSAISEVVYSNLLDTPILITQDSTAKTGLLFANGNTVKGVKSHASASITHTSLPISYMQSSIYKTIFPKTRVTLSGELYNGVDTYQLPLNFNTTDYLTQTETFIRSKSERLAEDDFILKIDLTSVTGNNDTSPLIDYSISNAFVYSYYINNDSTNENSSEGLAKSKYITKIIELADQMDAEDIRVLLTAYKPTTTNIKVFGKFLSSSDSTQFNEIPWSELVIDKNSSSSSANRFDYRDLMFKLSTATKLAGEGAFIESDAIKYISPNGSIFRDYKKFAIKIVFLSTSSAIVPRIKDIRAIALS